MFTQLTRMFTALTTRMFTALTRMLPIDNACHQILIRIFRWLFIFIKSGRKLFLNQFHSHSVRFKSPAPLPLPNILSALFTLVHSNRFFPCSHFSDKPNQVQRRRELLLRDSSFLRFRFDIVSNRCHVDILYLMGIYSQQHDIILIGYKMDIHPSSTRMGYNFFRKTRMCRFYLARTYTVQFTLYFFSQSLYRSAVESAMICCATAGFATMNSIAL